MANQTLSKHETEIRELLDRYVQAVNKKDLSALKACYATDSIEFDMMPPLQYTEQKKYFGMWQNCFENSTDKLSYSVKDVVIKADEKIAFAYYLTHFIVEMKAEACGGTAQNCDTWYRTTLCYEQINGKWLISHEHTSVPIDMETSKACMDLKPE